MNRRAWTKLLSFFVGGGASLFVIVSVIAFKLFPSVIQDLEPNDWLQDNARITVSTPTVHTRERLLNDRFEQVSWLDKKLKETIPAEALPKAEEKKSSSESGSSDKSDASKQAGSTVQLTDQSQLKYGGSRLDQFEILNGYRDVLRAERARAMLDDRHDMDGNTLNLLSFDATVAPRSSASGYAAIEVVITRSPTDLKDVAGRDDAVKRLDNLQVQDDFDIYVGWLEKLRLLYQNSVSQIAKALETLDISVQRGDFEFRLRDAVCQEIVKFEVDVKTIDVDRACASAINGEVDQPSVGGPGGNSPSLALQVNERLAKLRAQDAVSYIDDYLRRAAAVLEGSKQNDPGRIEPVTGLRQWNDVSQKVGHVKSGSNSTLDVLKPFVLAKADDDVRRALATFANTGSACQQTALPLSQQATQSLVSPFLLHVLAEEMPQLDVPKEVEAVCSQPVKPNQTIRLLYVLLEKLQTLNRPPTDMPLSGSKVENGEWLLNAAFPSEFQSIDATCVASFYLKEEILHADADQPHNHGARVSEFFDVSVDRLARFCMLVLTPRVKTIRYEMRMDDLSRPASTEDPTLRNLERLLEGTGYSEQPPRPRTIAYPYSLSPRLNESVTQHFQQRLSASAAVNGQTAGLEQSNDSDVQGIDATVVGFNRPESLATRNFRGARFGWIVAPRPDKNQNLILHLTQAQLGAVVAMPSWWRSALLQICTRFVKAGSVAAIMDAQLWSGSKDCRVEVIRLPGTSADLSRYLGMEVLTTPYMEEWNKPAVVYAADTNRPARLLINGERLWRSTVVTLGGQKADNIEVLPDMVGILATWDCVDVPAQSSDFSHGEPPPSAIVANQPSPAPTSSIEAAVQPASDSRKAGIRPVSTAPRIGSKVEAPQTPPGASGQFARAPENGATSETGPGDPNVKTSILQYEKWTVPVTVWTSEGHTNANDYAEVRLMDSKKNTPGCPRHTVAASVLQP